MKVYVEQTKKGDYSVVADVGTKAEKFIFKWNEEDTAETVAHLIHTAIDAADGNLDVCSAKFYDDVKQVSIYVDGENVGGMDIEGGKMQGVAIAQFINRVFQM